MKKCIEDGVAMKVICSNHQHCRFEGCKHKEEHEMELDCRNSAVVLGDGAVVDRGLDCMCKPVVDPDTVS